MLKISCSEHGELRSKRANAKFNCRYLRKKQRMHHRGVWYRLREQKYVKYGIMKHLKVKYGLKKQE